MPRGKCEYFFCFKCLKKYTILHLPAMILLLYLFRPLLFLLYTIIFIIIIFCISNIKRDVHIQRSFADVIRLAYMSRVIGIHAKLISKRVDQNGNNSCGTYQQRAYNSPFVGQSNDRV